MTGSRVWPTHPATLADLLVLGVEPEIRVSDAGQAVLPEGGEVGIELAHEAAHLALADPRGTHRPDEVVDLAGADALDVRLLDDRDQGALRPPARLGEPVGEVRARAGLGDRELEGAHARVERPTAGSGTRCDSRSAPGSARGVRPRAAPLRRPPSAPRSPSAGRRATRRARSSSRPVPDG